MCLLGGLHMPSIPLPNQPYPDPTPADPNPAPSHPPLPTETPGPKHAGAGARRGALTGPEQHSIAKRAC